MSLTTYMKISQFAMHRGPGPSRVLAVVRFDVDAADPK